MFRSAGGFLSKEKIKFFHEVSIKLKHQWIKPEGYDTGIKVYNKILNENVPLIVSNKNFVKWYICGPTVYNESHIGHGSVFVRNDILARILQHFFHITPVIALSVTDIDDKIIKQAEKLEKDWKSLAKEHELQFFQHLNELNVRPPSFALRVTEHIPEIINFIKGIVLKGQAYAVENGSVYFEKTEDLWSSTENFKPGALSPQQRSNKDFALWKGVKPGEPFWPSPWGDGRPGWHIECSAMASKVFGSNIDIHSGGIDLRFPHHENEETQSCSYYGCSQWVNYWMHTGSIMIEEQKMSKSLNNFVSLSDFLKKHTADEFRMYCFMSKYRNALHYSSTSMELPKSSVEIICRFIADANAYVKGNWLKGDISEASLLQELEETNNEIIEYLKDDLDTGKCYFSLMKLIRSTVKQLNKDPDASVSRSPGAVAAVSQYIDQILKIFGFQFEEISLLTQSGDIHKLEFIVDQAVSFRSQIRSEALNSSDKPTKKNILKVCDSFRDELKTIGIDIKDQNQNSSSWSFRQQQKVKESAAE